MQCDLPDLQSRCRVMFDFVPEATAKLIELKGRKAGSEDLKKKVGRMGKGVEFVELWESGGWCLEFKDGFNLDQ